MLINLTPHTLNIRKIDGTFLELPPSGDVARLSTATPAAEIHNDYPAGVRNATFIDGVQIRTPIVQRVIGLPDPVEGQAYIVSLVVRQAVPERLDVLSPGDLIRNEAGQPIGCDGLHANTTR